MAVAQAYLNEQPRILKGEPIKPLIKHLDAPVQQALDNIWKTMEKDVFTARAVIEVEVPAFRVLETLLDTFVEANEEIFEGKGEKAISKRSKLLKN